MGISDSEIKHYVNNEYEETPKTAPTLGDHYGDVLVRVLCTQGLHQRITNEFKWDLEELLDKHGYTRYKIEEGGGRR